MKVPGITSKNTILRLVEHAIFPKSEDSYGLFDDLKQRVEYVEPTQNLSDIQLLGMDIVPHKPELRMSYYIGVDWIDRKKDLAIEVLPKISNIDFQKMLMQCFKHKRSSDNIEEVFFFRADDKHICIPSTDFQLEPFIIINYLGLVQNIIEKGLKSNFVIVEEQLNGRIKGKIMTSRYLKHGFATGRKDIIDCKYQEYSVDCPENQILKAALLVIRRMMSDNSLAWEKNMFARYHDILNNCIASFASVSDVNDISSLQNLHISPMFVHYRSAIHLAKTIVRKQGVGISQSSETDYQMVPPFIINMALLFERYVFSLMLDRYEENYIRFQEGSNSDRPDFLVPNEQLIIDSKYIPRWEDQYVTENVRQLSGYGRSMFIRKMLGITDEHTTCRCLIIYPNINGIETFSDDSACLFTLNTDQNGNHISTIPQYQHFYKLPIRLPMV